MTQKQFSLRWRHNDHDGVSNHQPHHCLLNRLFRRRSKKTPKLRVTGLCGGNSPGTGEFPAQMASNAENVYIWWRHHVASLSRHWPFVWGIHRSPLLVQFTGIWVTRTRYVWPRQDLYNDMPITAKSTENILENNPLPVTNDRYKSSTTFPCSLNQPIPLLEYE